MGGEGLRGFIPQRVIDPIVPRGYEASVSRLRGTSRRFRPVPEDGCEACFAHVVAAALSPFLARFRAPHVHAPLFSPVVIYISIYRRAFIIAVSFYDFTFVTLEICPPRVVSAYGFMRTLIHVYALHLARCGPQRKRNLSEAYFANRIKNSE